MMSKRVSRRTFLMVLSACVCASLSSPLMGASKPKVKPNILIMVDDLGKEWIRCYGAQDIKTPNTDALIDFTDLLPTCVDLGGGQVPNDLTIDGESMGYEIEEAEINRINQTAPYVVCRTAPRHVR